MLQGLINRVFGTRHDRELKRVQPILDAIREHYERSAPASSPRASQS